MREGEGEGGTGETGGGGVTGGGLGRCAFGSCGLPSERGADRTGRRGGPRGRSEAFSDGLGREEDRTRGDGEERAGGDGMGEDP